MIRVVATIQLQPGTRAAYLAEFHKLVPLVRAEEGCVEYAGALDVASGLAVQPPVRPDVVTVIETWEDLPALAAHLAAPHMAVYRDAVKGYVAGVSLNVMEAI
jgi:quinol monooxygenase YgiN